MTVRGAFIKWFLLGGVVAGILLYGQAASIGGPAGLLQVGEDSGLRPMIEQQLGTIPLAPGYGHDGQIYYAIGLDLAGNEVPELLDHGAYRYRRVAYPATASLLGLLDGQLLLAGMITVTVLSTAFASGGMAAISVSMNRSDWLALVILANPGVWLSVRLLTADIFAIALMVLGLFWFLRARRASVVAFALSGLAKDVYLATPGGLAMSRDRRRWALILIPVGVLVVWMTWLTWSMGDGFTRRGNLSLPFVGMYDASSVWPSFDLGDTLYLIFALFSVAAGLAYSIFFRSWLRWSILAWSVLGVISSNWVWDLGNNAARVFAPIAVLVALALAGGRMPPPMFRGSW